MNYSEVAMAHLLSPAADVSSSFTSLEEHCGENSTWRRNGGDFDCLKEKIGSLNTKLLS